MLIKVWLRLCGAIAGAAFLLAVAPAAGTTLITEHEAQLPPDHSQMRSVERGPDIIAIYPAAQTGLIQSPFNFRIKFQAHGGTKIDLHSLIVTYKRIPSIDLTARVRPFAKLDGIDMPSAEVPPGAHRIWIIIKDSAGHEGRADINFTAGP